MMGLDDMDEIEIPDPFSMMGRNEQGMTEE